MDAIAAPRKSSPAPKFVTGSLLSHILVMTGAGALGLMAIFAGDLANMIFLSWLGDEAIIAAVGYASSIMFLTISIGIGLSIGAIAMVSPAIGAGQRVKARRFSVNAHILTFAVSAASALLIWVTQPWLLSLLGASGRTHDLAVSYLTILVPTLPALALGMTSAAVLRSVGDARRAMNVTLIGAVVNIILDPIFIFGFGWGLEGAALATGIARLAMMAIGYRAVTRTHNLMAPPRSRQLAVDAPVLMAVALPAILTNIATPVANAYITWAVAPFGDGAVAGWAIIGRIMPVAFGVIFALSGVIGPILGQNYGARDFGRLRRAMTLSLWVTVAFTALAWLALALASQGIVDAFGVSGEAADLVHLFCRWLSPLFVFMGALFVSNAAFNTLGRPHTSTALNWGRATLGTIPFAYVGGMLGGAGGVLVGNMLGGIVFGIAAVWLCYRHLDDLEVGAAAARAAPPRPEVPLEVPVA